MSIYSPFCFHPLALVGSQLFFFLFSFPCVHNCVFAPGLCCLYSLSHLTRIRDTRNHSLLLYTFFCVIVNQPSHWPLGNPLFSLCSAPFLSLSLSAFLLSDRQTIGFWLIGQQNGIGTQEAETIFSPHSFFIDIVKCGNHRSQLLQSSRKQAKANVKRNKFGHRLHRAHTHTYRPIVYLWTSSYFCLFFVGRSFMDDGRH